MTKTDSFLHDINTLKVSIKDVALDHHAGGELDVFNLTHPEGIFLDNEYEKIMNKLRDVLLDFEYLEKRVKFTGMIDGDTAMDVYENREAIEVLVEDDGITEYPYWFRTRIEYGGADREFCLYGLSHMREIDGLKFRIRK